MSVKWSKKNRKVWASALVLGATLAVGSGCPGDLKDLHSSIDVKLDPKLSHAEEKLLKADAEKLVSYKTKTHVDPLFKKIFGGDDFKYALEFLDQRVNYIIPPQIQIEDRLVLSQLEKDGFHKSHDEGDVKEDTSDMTQKERADYEREKKKKEDEARAANSFLVKNFSTFLWVLQKANTKLNMHFMIGKLRIPLESSRVGIVQIGTSYAKQMSSTGRPITTVMRAGSLIRAARHSDCTGGLLPENLKLAEMFMQPQGKCGHFYVACPKGHEYAGQELCDEHAWGASSVEAVFQAEVARNCKNCTETERQQAKAAAADAFARVIPLKEMMEGKLGQPDMSSTSDMAIDDLRDLLEEFKEGREEDPEQTNVRVEAQK